ncbi:MAG TPA: ornithine cyclodeaminase family protein [Chitinophagaceae bacterium]|jgi:ornithine cyclodeaminase|nr:ornithine cyclodeaminase family protein [Chitinophagaceae bacterium]
MDPAFIGKEKIASLLPMDECILVMEKMFRSLSNGECLQPLRSIMRLPDKTGLLGMMPGYAESLGVMGIKVISVFHGNKDEGYPSHQGVVILFDAKHGQPLMIFDAEEITAIRTAAASAVATRLLSRENSELLAIIGSGEQAKRHIESILLVRKIKQINLWSRNEKNAIELVKNISDAYRTPINIKKTVQEAVGDADIICTVTSSPQPLVQGDWISKGTHINAVGSSTPAARELDTATILKSKLFTDCYESIFNEAGDFLIPKKEGSVSDSHVKGELGEVMKGIKKGRENDKEITIFKSLGIAAEDIFSAWHIYKKL